MWNEWEIPAHPAVTITITDNINATIFNFMLFYFNKYNTIHIIMILYLR